MSGNASIKIPLNSLLSLLTREGFTISTGTILDIQKVLANLNEQDIEDIDSLKHILSPLICRNKGEQEKFYTLFDKYMANLHQLPPVVIQRKKRWPLVAGIITAIVVAIVLLIVLINTLSSPVVRKNPTADLTIIKNSGVAGDTAVISVTPKDTLAGHKYITNVHIDGKDYQDKREIQYKIPEAGDYSIKLSLFDSTGTGRELFMHERKEIATCEPFPSLQIKRVKSLPNSKLAASSKIYIPIITNASKDSNRYVYSWYINDSLAAHDKEFITDYSSDNPYEIKAVVDVKNIHCSTDSLTAVIQDMPRHKLLVSGTGKIDTQTKTNWGNILLAIFCVLALPLTGAHYFFWYKKRKEKPAVLTPGPEGTDKPPGDKNYDGPYMIEFKEQEDKISTEEGISQLAEILRKRHTSDIFQLNIRKTINKTIRKGGFPALHFSPKTQPLDFLILIDKEYPDGHLVKLFEHIIKRLRNEQVNLTVYSFYKEPLLLSNESLNHYLLPLERVARLYPNTILFIFTQANGFFKSFDVQLKDWVIEKFSSWNTKLIITPLAKDNWGVNELALYQAGFTVVPADVNAQQAISDEINDMIDKNKLKQDITPGVYSARLFNFNRVEQVTDYIDKAIAANARLLKTERNASLVKQWLFATALYPYVNWNVTVAVGKAIEEKKCSKSGELVNYTNLLLLSRIQWMNDAQLPDTLRGQLMQRLEKDIEVIARKAIVGMLNEIAPTVKEGSLVVEEFIYLKTTNKFLLHSNNKNDSDLSETEYEQMKAYTEKQYLDWALEEQLNNRSSNHLLKHPDNETLTVTPTEYFNLTKKRDDDKEEERIKKEKRDKRRKLVTQWVQTAGVFMAILITALLVLNAFSVSNNLWYTPPVNLEFSYKPGSYYRNQNASLTAQFGNSQPVTATKDDTVFRFSNIPAQYLDSQVVLQLQLTDGKQDQTFTATLDSLYSRFTIAFVPRGPRPPVSIRYNNPNIFDQVDAVMEALTEDYEVDYLLSDFTDSSRLIYYVQSDSAKADSIARIAGRTSGLNIPIVLIPENRNPPAVPLLFLNFDSATTLTRGTLPNWMNEIWSGGTSNRLLNINLSQKIIYYSTGEKNSFGTYRITEVYRIGAAYKIITQTTQGYKVFFFVPNRGNTFNLSVCQLFYATQQEAMAVQQSNCDRSNAMSVYYVGGNPNRIYLPVNANSGFNTVQYVKLQNLRDSVKSAYLNKWEVKIENTYEVNRTYLSTWSIPTLSTLLPNNPEFIPKSSTENNRDNPFDRNYLQINLTTTPPGGNNPPDNSKNDTRISWDQLITFNLDTDYQPVQQQSAEWKTFLSTAMPVQTRDTIKVVAYYRTAEEKKAAEYRVSEFKILLGQLIRTGISGRILTETRELQQQQQQQQQNAPASDNLNYVTIYRRQEIKESGK